MLFVAFPKLQQHVTFLGVSSFWNHKLRGGFSSLFSTLYECLFHDFSFKQGTGMWGEKGQLRGCQRNSPICRGVQASLLDSCCHDVDLSTADHGNCPVLHFCTFAVIKNQAKSFESSWWYFPKCCGLLASSNQPFLEQLTRHLKGSMCQSLLQELGGLILRVKLEGTCAFFLTELGMKSTCSNSGRGGSRKYHPAESGAPEDGCG